MQLRQAYTSRVQGRRYCVGPTCSHGQPCGIRRHRRRRRESPSNTGDKLRSSEVHQASSASSPCSTAAHAPLISVASSPLTEPDPTPVSPHTRRRHLPRGRGAALVTSRPRLATLQRPSSSRSIDGGGYAHAAPSTQPQVGRGTLPPPNRAAPTRSNYRQHKAPGWGRCSVLRPPLRRAPRPRPGDPLVLLRMRSAQHRG